MSFLRYFLSLPFFGNFVFFLYFKFENPVSFKFLMFWSKYNETSIVIYIWVIVLIIVLILIKVKERKIWVELGLMSLIFLFGSILFLQEKFPQGPIFLSGNI